MSPEKKITVPQQAGLLTLLQTRFEANPTARGHLWADVQAGWKLTGELWSLMSWNAPVVNRTWSAECRTGEVIFTDCMPEARGSQGALL